SRATDEALERDASVETRDELERPRRRLDRRARSVRELHARGGRCIAATTRNELLLELDRHDELETRREQLVGPAEARERCAPRERATDLVAGRLERVVVDSVHTRAVTPTGPPVEEDRALAHPPRADLVQVPRPRVDRAAEVFGLARELLVPRRRMVERIGLPDRQDPRVAALDALHPRERPLVCALLVGADPAREHRHVPVLGEMAGRLEKHASRDLVASQPAVAVRPPVLGGDDVRRVARDQVEALAGDGVEEAAEPRLDVPETVQRRVEIRERDRARVDVGGGHMGGVAGCHQRLDTAPGADVQGANAAHARCEAVAYARRERVRGDVVRRVLALVLRVVVRRDEEIADRQDPRAEPVRLPFGDEPDRLERPNRTLAERPRDVGARSRKLQEERANDGAETRRRDAPLVERQLVAPVRVHLVAEHVEDTRLRVPDAPERGAEGGGRLEVGTRVGHRRRNLSAAAASRLDCRQRGGNLAAPQGSRGSFLRGDEDAQADHRAGVDDVGDRCRPRRGRGPPRRRQVHGPYELEGRQRLRQLRHVPRRGQVAEGLLVRHARLLRVRDVPGGRGSLLDLARAAAEGGAGDGAGHVLRHVGGRELERRRRGNDDQGERQRLVHELERGEGHDRDLGVERERRLVRAGEDDVRGEARRSLSLPSFVRCPACRGSLDATLRCTSCDRAFRVEDGIPRLLAPTAPGLAAKLRELDAWPELAREQGWYLLDDRVDAALPYLNSRLGWDDRA